MNQLAKIIDAATSDDVSISSLLRKVRVVASRLDAVSLAQWVDRELAGYDKDSDVPEYRGPFPTQVIGHFTGPYGSEAKVALPTRAIPEQVGGEAWFSISFVQPVRELEELAISSEQLSAPIPADIVSYLNGLMDRGDLTLMPMHRLFSAHRSVSRQQVQGVLDQVRTRVLNFALDLEKVAPDAGEPDAAPVDASTVYYMTSNHIYGDGNAVAVGSPGATQNVSVVKKGDLDSLLKAVSATGVGQETVDELREAVEADNADRSNSQEVAEPGPRVQGFLGKMALGVGGKVAIGAAGGTIANLIKAYFGL